MKRFFDDRLRFWFNNTWKTGVFELFVFDITFWNRWDTNDIDINVSLLGFNFGMEVSI